MNFSVTNVLAWTLAVLLHGAVIGAFFVEWGEEPVVEAHSDRPYFIPAQMVSENPHTAKAEKAANQEAARREQQRREKVRREKAAKEKAIQQKQILEEQNAAAERKELDRLERLKAQQLQKQALLAQEQAEQEKRLAQELKAQQEERAESELQQLINAELGAIEAVTDAEKAMAYVGQIQADIIQNWSRPPSARNGMQALLKVFLVPTGEVVDVAILKTSGNDAFDRSAIQAVRKVRRFDVPKDSRLFESKFREFEVLFRPEDLRL